MGLKPAAIPDDPRNHSLHVIGKAGVARYSQALDPNPRERSANADAEGAIPPGIAQAKGPRGSELVYRLRSTLESGHKTHRRGRSRFGLLQTLRFRTEGRRWIMVSSAAFFAFEGNEFMAKQTVLYPQHKAMGARLVPFGGWDMPLHYGSQLEEHHQVRRDAGMFDVSHMTVVDLRGREVRSFLRHLLANDVERLKKPGKALYSCMLNEQGGVIDDLIVYYLQDDWYRMVVNAGTTEKDLTWLEQRQAGYELRITPRRDLAMIAVQGPHARDKTLPLLPVELQAGAAELTPFNAAPGTDWLVARTGYTGEDGFEIMLPVDQAAAFWQALADAGVAPCGLGARDTLRLEAGMNLYGSDMDEATSPLEAGLTWTVAWEPPDRQFIGREALERQRNDPEKRRFVGLVLNGRGVLRNHLKLFAGDEEVGEITSGGFAPTLERSIALARVKGALGETCDVEIRGKRIPARVVKPPFVRHGKACIEL